MQNVGSATLNFILHRLDKRRGNSRIARNKFHKILPETCESPPQKTTFLSYKMGEAKPSRNIALFILYSALNYNLTSFNNKHYTLPAQNFLSICGVKQKKSYGRSVSVRLLKYLSIKNPFQLICKLTAVYVAEFVGIRTHIENASHFFAYLKIAVVEFRIS